jgi:hypothetical protein
VQLITRIRLDARGTSLVDLSTTTTRLLLMCLCGRVCFYWMPITVMLTVLVLFHSRTRALPSICRINHLQRCLETCLSKSVISLDRKPASCRPGDPQIACPISGIHLPAELAGAS